jgi:hypothetical protein
MCTPVYSSSSLSIGGLAAAAGASAREELALTRAFRVDITTGDIVHNGRSLQRIGGLDSIAQSLRTRLSFFRGEWFLDEFFGVPYFQSVLGKFPLAGVREVFRAIIADTPGVLDILTLSLVPSGTVRAFRLEFKVSTDLGELALTVPTTGV